MSKKLSQNDLRQMMQKMKVEKGGPGNNKFKKYKLSSREVALIEEEKKRKAEDENEERRKIAKKAGVPENFFDSAKTKAFLNLNKAPAKSILKKKGGTTNPATVIPGANLKASGREWTSSAPTTATALSKATRTPAGGSIKHLQEDDQGLPSDFFDNKSGGSGPSRPSDVPGSSVEGPADQPREEDGDLPEGFFDDPIQDAKARGIEYKDPAEEEWEAFKKEISHEVAAADDVQDKEELEDTTARQMEEIEDQMQAWSRVREAEIKKDQVDEKLKVVKSTKRDNEGDDDSDMDEEANLEMDEFLDWRLKKS